MYKGKTLVSIYWNNTNAENILVGCIYHKPIIEWN